MDKTLTLARSCNSQIGVSRSIAPHKLRRSLPGSPADPCFQPTVPGVQQQNTRGEGHRYSRQPIYAPNLNGSTSTMPTSQSNPPSSSPPQASGSRYPFPNITPQQIVYGEWSQPYFITPIQTVPAVIEQSSRGRRSRASSRSAASPPNTAPDWSPRNPWHQNHFQPSYHHPGFVSGYADPITNRNWQEPQLTAPNNFSGMPSMGKNHVYCTNMDNLLIQAGLNQVGHTQQPAPMMPAPSGILVAGENEMPFQDINILPGQADFMQLRNLQELPPATAYELSDTCSTAEAQIHHLDMHTFAGQADFNPNESWLAPAFTIPGDLPSTHSLGGNQPPLPDSIMLPMQPDFIANGNLVEPVSVRSNDLSCTLGMEGSQIASSDVNTTPMQAGFIPDANWLGLASVAADDFLCTIGMEEDQALFPDLNAPSMQAACLLNGNLQEPVEPGSISNIFESEDTQTLQLNPGALPAEAMDALWRTIEETAPGEFQGVLRAAQGQIPYSEGGDFSEYIDFTAGNNPQEPELSALDNPSVVLGMGDHQAFKRDEDTFPERLDHSTVEAFQKPETATAINRFNFLGTGQQQMSHLDQDGLSEHPIVTIGEDCDVLLPKSEDSEDEQPAAPIDPCSPSGPDKGAVFELDPAALSGLANSLVEYGIPDDLWDIGAIGESQMSPDGAMRHPPVENNNWDGEKHDAV